MRIGNPGCLTASHRYGAAGFTYVWLLFLVALLGIVLAAVGVVWQTEVKREKEKQLLFVGKQFQRAITSYHAVTVNGSQQFPQSLEELLEDHRFPMPVRHLRQIYTDPMSDLGKWGLIKTGPGISGVYSLSQEAPMKKSGFDPCCSHFSSAKAYSDWQFTMLTETPDAGSSGASAQ